MFGYAKSLYSTSIITTKLVLFLLMYVNSNCLANSPSENKITFVFTQIGSDFAELKIDFPEVIHNLKIQRSTHLENFKPLKDFVGNHSEILLIDQINSFHEVNVSYKLSYTDQNNEDFSIIYSCLLDTPVIIPILLDDKLILKSSQEYKNENISILIYDMNELILYQNDLVNVSTFSFPIIDKKDKTWFLLYEFKGKRGILKI